MTPKHFYLLLLALVACRTALAQNEDELQIPVEKDNQFPPDNPSDLIEGSGGGVIEEPAASNAEVTEAPPIEHIDARILSEDDVETSTQGQDDECPKRCVCHSEGSTNDFVINCSGYDLTEFPSPLNEKATILNIQNNKITEIPKSISTLKNLKVLKANDNSIATIVPGSISELPELVTLQLRNNRLIEYPNDLKNGFGLLKLQEIDLGGNDMRTNLATDTFSKFESLRLIVLPTSTPELQQDLCDVMSKTLKMVCTGSCDQESLDCQEGNDDDDLSVSDDTGAFLPGMLVPSNDEDDSDPNIETQENKDAGQNNSEQVASSTTLKDDLPKVSGESTTSGEFSFRSAVNKQPSDVASFNAAVEIPKVVSDTTEGAVEIGATTTNTKTGGVNTTIIGLVVVGMVVIVAVITIKKNWSSIKNRCGSNSNSRTPNQPAGGTANGTAPEEVPLQEKDKSPV